MTHLGPGRPAAQPDWHANSLHGWIANYLKLENRKGEKVGNEQCKNNNNNKKKRKKKKKRRRRKKRSSRAENPSVQFLEGIRGPMELQNTVKEALNALYHHPDDSIRARADRWLQDFQRTVDAWQVVNRGIKHSLSTTLILSLWSSIRGLAVPHSFVFQMQILLYNICDKLNLSL